MRALGEHEPDRRGGCASASRPSSAATATASAAAAMPVAASSAARERSVEPAALERDRGPARGRGAAPGSGRAAPPSRSAPEERELRRMTDRRHDESAVQVLVEALAAALGEEQAPMTCRALEPALGVILLGRVSRADRIVRAQPAEVEGVLEVRADLPALLDRGRRACPHFRWCRSTGGSPPSAWDRAPTVRNRCALEWRSPRNRTRG